MKEKMAKVIFWLISLFMFMAFINCVCGMNVQNNIDGFSVLALGIITNPFIVDKISKKVGAEEPDYLYACKMLLIFGGILFSFIIALIVYKFIDTEIDEKITLQNFEAILKITIYVIYLIVFCVCKSANKVFKYIVFGMFYFTCVILSFTSQSINERLIGILNSLPNGHLDMSTFELLINDFLIPIKEAILTYIIFDTIMINKNRKQDKIGVVNVIKDRANKIIEVNAMTKYQLCGRWHNKKKKYTPYNFDEKEEYKIYSQIGQMYYKKHMGKKSKKNNKILPFDKYSDWEKYFKNKFLSNEYNTRNFHHYLNEKLRFYQIFEECFKSLVIPIYVAILTIILTIYSTVPIRVEINELIITLLGGTIVIIIVGMFYLYQHAKNINFYGDCIKIIENSKPSHQK